MTYTVSRMRHPSEMLEVAELIKDYAPEVAELSAGGRKIRKQ